MCYLFIFKITVVWHLYFLFNPRNCTLHQMNMVGSDICLHINDVDDGLGEYKQWLRESSHR